MRAHRNRESRRQRYWLAGENQAVVTTAEAEEAGEGRKDWVLEALGANQ